MSAAPSDELLTLSITRAQLLVLKDHALRYADLLKFIGANRKTDIALLVLLEIIRKAQGK